MSKKFKILIRKTDNRYGIEHKTIMVKSIKEKITIRFTCQRHKRDDGTMTEWYALRSKHEYDLLYKSFCDLKELSVIKAFSKDLNDAYKYDVDLMDILKVAFGATEEKTDTDYVAFTNGVL